MSVNTVLQWFLTHEMMHAEDHELITLQRRARDDSINQRMAAVPTYLWSDSIFHHKSVWFITRP